jgi:hypothetical protein
VTRVLAAFRRRPVRLYLYGLLVPGFGVALAYGLTTADKAALWITLGGAVLVVGGGEFAQTKTTPYADPRTQDGAPAYIARDDAGGEL